MRQQIPLSKRALTVILAALSALTSLSIDMSLGAMPQLQKVFHADVSAVQLTLSLFLLGYAVGQVVSGPLSDRWGRKPVLLVGISVFIVAGLVAACSTSLPMLIAVRLVQGLGASVGPILARAIIRDLFESHEAAGVLSQMTQVLIIAPLIAPSIGGYLMGWFGWSSIFFLLAASGAVLFYMCWRYLPETMLEAHSEAGDLRHILVGFRTVFSHRESLRHILTVAFSYSAMFAFVSGVPFIYMDVFHVPEHKFGIYFAVTALALMMGVTANRALLKHHAPLTLLRYGVLLLFGAGCLLAVVSWLQFGGLAGVIVPMMIYLFALGIVQPNATAAAMAPHGRLAGIASSIIGGLQTGGGAVAGYFVAAFFNQSALSLGVTVAVLSFFSLLAFDRSRVTGDTSRHALAQKPV
jgi:DHA1 family bicyclomycin/chloramphenicol resistance-like MFS transporter